MNLTYRHDASAPKGGTLTFTYTAPCGQVMEQAAVVHELGSDNPGIQLPLGTHTLGLRAVTVVLNVVRAIKSGEMPLSGGIGYDRGDETVHGPVG